MNTFIALLPLLCIFGLLFGFRLTAVKAGLIVLVLCILLVHFSSFHLNSEKIVHEVAKGGLISFIAAYILFFGLFLYHLMNEKGVITSVATFITNVTSDKLAQVLLIVIGFAPLLESATGFGISFVILSPILYALGFPGRKAVLIGLIGMLAVPWGALSTGTVIGAELSGVPLEKIGMGSAILSIPVFFYFLIIAALITGGASALKKKWKEIVFLVAIFSICICLFNQFVSVELAGVLSSMVTLLAQLCMITFASKRSGSDARTFVSAAKEETKYGMLKVFSPYLFLTALIFVTRLVPPIKQWLLSTAVIDLPAFSFSMPLLYSPGFWLLVTCIFTVVIFKMDGHEIKTAYINAVKQWVPFMISTTCFVAIAEIMTESGMIGQLSNRLAIIFGSSYLFISPFIGGLGGYLTGSNTGSNAMFIPLQAHTAKQLGISNELIIAIQNASGSHATMGSPFRVVLGAELCNVREEQTRLIKEIAFIVVGALLIISVMSFFLH
ncbi:L-lactate permease [Fictibacillus sp. Mic-4]|uniref:L-lactate permease n=1 Tax=Fictibacillus sp. Mic-4 TaxID=3132826 RepID=UPI003CF2455B